MQRSLDVAAALVRRRPGTLLAALAVVTLLLGGAASQIRVGVDIADYGTGTELSEAFQRVSEEFGTRNAAVTVIVDAGEGGTVLDREGLRLARRLEAAARDSDAAPALAPEAALSPAVLTWATPVDQGLELLGTDLDEVDDSQLGTLRAEAYAAVGAAQAAALLPEEADAAAGEARGGLVIVRLDPDLSAERRVEASLTIGRALDGVDAPGYQVLPFNQALLEQELEGSLADELPLLLVAEAVIITAILALAFRRISDVILALVGMALTLVWLFGLVSLLGPGMLDVAGPFRQVSIAVPVLLVGLSVDYSFHLTMRYREERDHDADAGEAAATAVRTVGRGLVLVTLTTAIGFFANIVSPLPPIVDFAVFAAVGILGTLVVMGTFVPAARHLLDRRRGAGTPPPEQAGKVVDAMAAAARATARHPVPTLAVVVVLAGLGVAAATDLGTEFDQEQFIPDDTRVAAVFEAAEELFGGGITEETSIFVEGPTTEPAVANAVLDTEERLADVELVDTVDGEPEVTSPPGLVARLGDLAGADAGPVGLGLPDDLGPRLEELGWEGDRFADDAEVGALYDLVGEHLPGQLDQVLSDERDSMLVNVDTSAGDERVDQLVAGMRDAAAPIGRTDAELTVVSQELLAQQTLDALAESQAEKIGFTVLAAGALLILYYRLARRQAMLGFITLVPTLLALPMVLGGMWLLGFTFNALTATIAAIAIGFGVDYGIHLSNRFTEERDRADDVAEGIRGTVVHTGAALVASAATTAGGFAVLGLSGIAPIRQFGVITAMTIVVALVTTLFAQTSALVLWDRAQRRADDRAERRHGTIGADRPDRPGTERVPRATEEALEQ